MPPADAPVFEALIAPYRSLGRRGVSIVVAVFALISVLLSMRFWIWGAWPVVIFSLLEIPLVALLLVLNLRRARATELIMLDRSHLTVIRTDMGGQRRQVTLPAAWLQIEFQEGRGIPRILARSHGRGCELGAFLHEQEKLALYGQLKGAIEQVRNPRFDNPQLREDPG